MESDKNKEFCFSMLCYESFCRRQSIMTPLSLPPLPARSFSPIISQRRRASLGFHAGCLILHVSYRWVHRSSVFCPCFKLAGYHKRYRHVRTALCPKDYAPSIHPHAHRHFSIVIYFWTETVLH